MNLSKSLPVFSVLSVVLSSTMSANAVTLGSSVDSELSLLVDVSGSVDSTEFALQRDGYVQAFNDPQLYNDFLSKGSHGSLAVNLIYWSGSNHQSVAVDWTKIDSVASSQKFASQIESVSRPFAGSTRPSDAIDFAVREFTNNGFDSNYQVIDVSGDGTGSAHKTLTARDNALASGIDSINGLAIGGLSSVENFYQNNIQGGEHSFTKNSNNFQVFGGVVKEKLQIETSARQEVPESASIPSLLAVGILGMGTVCLRKKA